MANGAIHKNDPYTLILRVVDSKGAPIVLAGTLKVVLRKPNGTNVSPDVDAVIIDPSDATPYHDETLGETTLGAAFPDGNACKADIAANVLDAVNTWLAQPYEVAPLRRFNWQSFVVLDNL